MSEPLDAAATLKKPCTALSTKQVVDVGLASPRTKVDPNAASLGVSCSWVNADASSSLSISWQNQNSVGLDLVYQRRDEQAYFEETNVSGYPAVFANSNDARSFGECVIHVGVSDKLKFFSQMQAHGNPPKEKSCDLAKQAATDVIQNLKQGGS